MIPNDHTAILYFPLTLKNNKCKIDVTVLKIISYLINLPLRFMKMLFFPYFLDLSFLLCCCYNGVSVEKKPHIITIPNPGVYLRKIAPMASTKIAFYIYYLLIISPGIHVYVYYMVFAKLLQENYLNNLLGRSHMGTLGAKTSQWRPLQVPPWARALLAIP